MRDERFSSVWLGCNPNDWNLADRWTNHIQAYGRAQADMHAGRHTHTIMHHDRVKTHTHTHTLVHMCSQRKGNPWLLAVVTFTQSILLHVWRSVHQREEARTDMGKSFNNSLISSPQQRREEEEEKQWGRTEGPPLLLDHIHTHARKRNPFRRYL